MSIRKRNEFLDGDDSDEELADGYDSEAVEESRGDVIRHATKRRKVDEESEDSFHDLDEELSEDEGRTARRTTHPKSISSVKKDAALHIAQESDDDSPDQIAPKIAEKNPESSTLKQAEKAQKAVRKSGVIYISRVPPFMKPHTLRHFLEPHARKGLGRIFLTPEEHTTYTKRVKNGGNKKRSFTDGWVEFVSKTEAKVATETLNGNIIGGKKGNFYHDDIWNMKYLKGFKWNHLTEQISNENAERAARLREEIRKTRDENKAFVLDIEKSKMLDGMESKRRARQEDVGRDPAAAAVEPLKRAKRDFKQRKARSKEDRDGDVTPGQDVKRVLNSLFS